ncbi:hypothetical protein GCM10009808_07910 [Microbacterium sediminicola]|uniref:Uncharacterized protein n=1 Tax=Microbacterium sediminicola TaxID=415210 RepID=A0ABN2HTC3_9MICO
MVASAVESHPTVLTAVASMFVALIMRLAPPGRADTAVESNKYGPPPGVSQTPQVGLPKLGL